MNYLTKAEFALFEDTLPAPYEFTCLNCGRTVKPWTLGSLLQDVGAVLGNAGGPGVQPEIEDAFAVFSDASAVTYNAVKATFDKCFKKLESTMDRKKLEDIKILVENDLKKDMKTTLQHILLVLE